ncbi:laforin-like [Haliaeetus albicilla]|uniref:laforin-like n=1 Tax=Haliaeetus albicilla TaxID=8969 RepID=UPI0037E8221A
MTDIYEENLAFKCSVMEARRTAALSASDPCVPRVPLTLGAEEPCGTRRAPARRARGGSGGTDPRRRWRERGTGASPARRPAAGAAGLRVTAAGELQRPIKYLYGGTASPNLRLGATAATEAARGRSRAGSSGQTAASSQKRRGRHPPPGPASAAAAGGRCATGYGAAAAARAAEGAEGASAGRSPFPPRGRGRRLSGRAGAARGKAPEGGRGAPALSPCGGGGTREVPRVPSRRSPHPLPEPSGAARSGPPRRPGAAPRSLGG